MSNNNKTKLDITKEPTESLYKIFHSNVKARDVYLEMAETARKAAFEIDLELTKRAEKAQLAIDNLLAKEAAKK